MAKLPDLRTRMNVVLKGWEFRVNFSGFEQAKTVGSYGKFDRWVYVVIW